MKPVAQALPQPLQWFLSLVMSTQTPLQSTVGAAQTHLPAWQTVPPVQARPQPPQLSGLVWRSIQLFAQFVVPGSQDDLHAPRLQT